MAKQRKRSADDVPELGREWFAGATKIADGPDAMRAYVHGQRRKRGKQKAPTKKLVSLRLDSEAVERYRGTGRGWQSRINDLVVKSSKKLSADR